MGCCQSIDNEIETIYINFYVYLDSLYPNNFFGKNDIQKYKNFIKALKNIVKGKQNCYIKVNKHTKFVISFLKNHQQEFYNSLLNNKKYKKHILKLNNIHYNYN